MLPTEYLLNIKIYLIQEMLIWFNNHFFSEQLLFIYCKKMFSWEYWTKYLLKLTIFLFQCKYNQTLK